MKKKFIKHGPCPSRPNTGLYDTLRKRGLLDRAFSEGIPSLSPMSDDERTRLCNILMRKGPLGKISEEEKERREMQRIGLYFASMKRELLDSTDSEEKMGPEKKTGDGRGVEIVTLLHFPSIQKDYGSHSIVFENGRGFRKLIDGGQKSVKPTPEEVEQFKYDVSEAAKSDPKVAKFLAVNPELACADEGMRKRKPKGLFSDLSDDELVDRAKRLMRKNKISGRKQLQQAHASWYHALRKKKLLDRI